jgi:hypothetical protein
MAVMGQKLAVGKVDRALQKPWLYHGVQVREMTSLGEIIYCLVHNGHSKSAFLLI